MPTGHTQSPRGTDTLAGKPANAIWHEGEANLMQALEMISEGPLSQPTAEQLPAFTFHMTTALHCFEELESLGAVVEGDFPVRFAKASRNLVEGALNANHTQFCGGHRAAIATLKELLADRARRDSAWIVG